MPSSAIKFLIVDDLESNLLALEGLLRRDGLQLLHARSGPEALELLLVHDVGLAIIDVQMPSMDGYELAELMRGTERTRRVPIIFLTAGAVDQQRRFRGYEAGAVDFLFKPIEPHILQSKAGVFFELSRQRQELARQRDELRLATEGLRQEHAQLLEADEALRQSEQTVRLERGKLEAVLNGMSEGINVADAHGNVLLMNPAGAALLGYSNQNDYRRALLDFKDTWELRYPDGRPMPIDEWPFSRVLRGETLCGFEAIVRRLNDHREMVLSYNGGRIADASGSPHLALLTFRDVTERYRAQRALQESVCQLRQTQSELCQAQTELQRHNQSLESVVEERTAKLRETIGDLEAFSYSISHDMRAPLRAMQGYSDALLEDHSSSLQPEAQDYLQRIQRAAQRMDALIQDVLAYSKVAKGDVELQAVDLESIIEDVRQNYPQLHSQSARISVDHPLPQVIGHEAYLTQIVSNLLGNAVKFVAPGVTPEIRIEAEPRGDRVRIWFHDNGIGIAAEHFGRIFQIFGRVHAQKEFEGTGIGLAVVKKAVDRMDGFIGVESELGKGSHFWVELKPAHGT